MTNAQAPSREGADVGADTKLHVSRNVDVGECAVRCKYCVIRLSMCVPEGRTCSWCAPRTQLADGGPATTIGGCSQALQKNLVDLT